ncbi:hypothetical protein BC937DRAFT_87542 [Endogone sp. FLAS-F59071]|nr:hypothetical protein BC937DRAFT_87542 [Endogone sp. FLAS-F59071]|eukprot:RUS22731.1 hypothetical protein BC937DRAFT_87542 [Endogone sp. FLAS-F59071]
MAPSHKHSTSTASSQPSENASRSRAPSSLSIFSRSNNLLMRLNHLLRLNRSFPRRSDHTGQSVTSTTQKPGTTQEPTPYSGSCCTNRGTSCKCGIQAPTNTTPKLCTQSQLEGLAIREPYEHHNGGIQDTAADSNHAAQPIRKDLQPDDGDAIVSEPPSDQNAEIQETEEHVTQINEARQATRATTATGWFSKLISRQHRSKQCRPKPQSLQTQKKMYDAARRNKNEEKFRNANEERTRIIT